VDIDVLEIYLDLKENLDVFVKNFVCNYYVKNIQHFVNRYYIPIFATLIFYLL
jgi:hypothetical protein